MNRRTYALWAVAFSIGVLCLAPIYNPPTGGGGVWGAITGTLSAQTDLANALNAKVTGPASSTDGGLPQYDGTTGKLLKSVLTVTTDPEITDNTSVPTTAAVGTAITNKIDDTSYDATSWNGDTAHAPSKNAVRDKIESMAHSGGVIGTGWATIVAAAVDTQFVNGVASSFTYVGTGDYTVTLFPVQADTNYIAHVTVEGDTALSAQVPLATKTVNDFKILVFRGSDGAARDAAYVQITVERLSQ